MAGGAVGEGKFKKKGFKKELTDGYNGALNEAKEIDGVKDALDSKKKFDDTLGGKVANKVTEDAGGKTQDIVNGAAKAKAKENKITHAAVTVVTLANELDNEDDESEDEDEDEDEDEEEEDDKDKKKGKKKKKKKRKKKRKKAWRLGIEIKFFIGDAFVDRSRDSWNGSIINDKLEINFNSNSVWIKI